MDFNDFTNEARWILRYQDEEETKEFLLLAEMALGFHQLTDGELEDRVEDYYIESIRGGASEEKAKKDTAEHLLKLILRPPDEYYMPSSDPTIKARKEAIRYLDDLKRLQIAGELRGNFIDLHAVENSRNALVSSLKANEVLNTGGKPTGISDNELAALIRLKCVYGMAFPKNSNRYTQGNLLHQLGEYLIGKKISRKINSLIKKGEKYIRDEE